MRSLRACSAILPLILLAAAIPAAAQSGEGSLRGYVKDEQGGVLPGVTITAKSPDLIGSRVAVTDASGYYRLINLQPGTYTVTAELTGFATFKREGILVRAGSTFAVDVTMKVGGLQESVTVTGESPMLEVSKPGNVLTIQGEFQNQMPIAARRNWSDFLEQTPGVHSRPFDDGSGRMVYFGHSTEHFAHVVQLEGMQAGNYNDFQLTYVQMGADMMQDVQVKIGGVDASTPMGTGLAINVVTKSGGNVFKGTAGWAFQPLRWNDDNTGATTVYTMPSDLVAITGKPSFQSTGGTPAQNAVNQIDGGLGGPIKKDRIWFFGSLRVSRVQVPIARTTKQVSDIHYYFPDRTLFNNQVKSYQPYLKVTAQLSPRHELTAFWQRDRLDGTSTWEYNFDRVWIYSNGGNLFTTKLSSLWGSNIATTFLAGYNNKGGASASTYKAWPETFSGPLLEVYNNATVTQGRMTGTSLILEGGNRDDEPITPCSLMTFRGDVTWYKQGWGGSHEFQTGFFAEPRNTYTQTTHYTNNGFIMEEQAPLDPANPQKLVPFHRQYVDPLSITTRDARDSDYGFYGQDSWKPVPRLTTNIGIRFDYTKRVDNVFHLTREHAWTVQPRLGFSYLLTADAKNVLRGSYVRVGEQVMGRDAITTFGTAGKVNTTDIYDNNLNGVWGEAGEVFSSPAQSASLASYLIDPKNHQPYLDEFIVGFRRQFPAQTSVDVAWIKRSYHDMWAQVEVNGFWPSGPNQPFGGFGKIDPSRGALYQQTNNTWSTLEYQALELTAAKNMSHRVQFTASFSRQWHHMAGTWNPTDPARFIAPNAFANDKNLYMPRGNNDGNSLPNTGNALSYGPTWMKYRGSAGGVVLAPYGINVAGSLTVQAGPWSGSPLYRLPASDPQVKQFGPSKFTLSNGTTASNPLAIQNRYVYQDRGTGQFQAPTIVTLGLKVGKRFKLGGDRDVEVAGNVFNLVNAGAFTQFTYNSAYQTWSANFLEMRNRQQARAFQFTTVFRF